MSKTYSAGIVTAYGAAKRAGYTGTYEDFCRQQAQYADNASAVEQAKQTAVNASQSANQAKQDAQTASTTAQSASQSAQGSAQSAGQSAQDAQTAKNNAQTYAQSASQSAGSAQQSAQSAQSVLESIPEDYSDLSEDVDKLKADLGEVEDWLGFPTNLFDARLLATSNSNNWSIDSATKTSVTITHKTTYSTGVPIVTLDLPSGTYVFHADYTESDTAFSYRVNGTWVKALTDGAEFTIDSTKTNDIYFTNSVAGTYTITDISVVAKEQNGKIQEIEDDISQLSSTANVLSAEVDDLQDGFADISSPVTGEIVSEETNENKTISSTGALITAGYVSYKVVKYPVNAGKTYWLTASANWGNLLWCFYDANDNVIQTGTASERGATFTSVTDQEVTAPSGATYIRTTYNTTVKQGACKAQTGFTLAKKWVGKKWVCVGDSLTAENIRTTKHYFDYVAETTGITTVNMGDSGSGYAREQDVNTAFYQRIGDCPTDADVVTIFGSFNDLGAGLLIGSVDDTGTTTLAGCINTTIDNLQAVIPTVRLGIVAPTPWDTTQPSTSGQAYNYVSMLKAICERRSIPFLDLWRCSNLRPWDSDFRALAYSKDGGSGTHPDETGHAIIAPRFKAFLESLIM